jgi:hypothetical protein
VNSLLKMQNSYRYVAVHEAGHAVASFRMVPSCSSSCSPASGAAKSPTCAGRG